VPRHRHRLAALRNRKAIRAGTAAVGMAGSEESLGGDFAAAEGGHLSYSPKGGPAISATIHAMARSRAASNLVELQPSISEMVHYLQDALGSRLTALLLGVTDARVLDDWARGEASPDSNAERRVRDAFRITELLLQEESPQAVSSWFLGMNPELDDRAPALVLGDEPELVAEAAQNFLATG
jgi:hypothetical protein